MSNVIYRFYEQKAESIDHLVPGCSILTPLEYKEKLDKIGHYIHWKVCKYYRIMDFEKSSLTRPIIEAKEQLFSGILTVIHRI